MAENVLSAAKGSKRAMTALFNENKNEAYSLALLLLKNEEKAESITLEAVTESFDKLRVKNIVTDKEFNRFIKCEIAKKAAAELFGADIKSFRIQRVTAAGEGVFETEFSGAAAAEADALGKALDSCDKYAAFVYLLKTAGGLTFGEIGQVIAQREIAAKYFYDIAVKELTAVGCKQLSFAASMYNQYINGIKIPESLENDTKAAIKSRAVFELPSKRAMTAIITLVSVVFLAFFAGVILYYSLPDADLTSSNSSGTDSAASDSASEYSGYKAPEIDTEKTYTADINIKDFGTVKVKLEPKEAPQTVANFVDLANKGFYNGLTFHRIMEDFMMQGGDPNGDGTGGSENTIFGEFSANGYENTLKHTEGAISMARSDDMNSASSQFFIVHKTYPSLDGQYAVFGYVTEGMDIVDKICTETENSGENGAVAKENQPVIETIKINVE